MEIRKIVLTGGPGGGKTTALSRIPEYFTKLGWRVIVVSETATDFFSAGFTPDDFKGDEDTWRALEGNIMLSQINKEKTMKSLALASLLSKEAKKVLIVCDRGLLDNQAYMTEEDFWGLMKQMPECNGYEATYDAVFHIVTAADGAEEFYTKKGEDNNGKEKVVRDEDLEDARALDLRLQKAWSWHPHYRITRNEAGITFKQKIDKVLTQIAEFLGEPVPYEIERKYIVRYPDVAQLMAMENCQKQRIMQTYLPPSKDGEEVRVRLINSGHWRLFTQTTKLKTEVVGSRIEIERNISENEYLQSTLTGISSLRKDRYAILLRENSRCIELDVYPDDNEYAILEIEVPNMDAPVTIPGYITVIHEVTGDPRFDNATIAANGGRLPALNEALFKI